MKPLYLMRTAKRQNVHDGETGDFVRWLDSVKCNERNHCKIIRHAHGPVGMTQTMIFEKQLSHPYERSYYLALKLFSSMWAIFFKWRLNRRPEGIGPGEGKRHERTYLEFWFNAPKIWLKVIDSTQVMVERQMLPKIVVQTGNFSAPPARGPKLNHSSA